MRSQARVGDGGEREAGRRHQRLLRAGHDDVGAPGVGLERHGAEARHGIDDRERAGLAAHGEQRLEVADDAGRRLGVDDERRSSRRSRASASRRSSGLRRLAPRVRERDDVAAERARHRLPALAELALRDREHPLAGREEVDDRRLERAGARRREDENLVLRAEDLAQPLLREVEDRGEVGRAMVEHRLATARAAPPAARRSAPA